MTINPPPNYIEAPIVSRVVQFYKKVYLLKTKISKRDQFGIYLKIENLCLDTVQLIMKASLESRSIKLPTLYNARINIELLKKLFSICHDLNIIPPFRYIELESDLQEISMMTNGWIKYLTAAQ